MRELGGFPDFDFNKIISYCMLYGIDIHIHQTSEKEDRVRIQVDFSKENTPLDGIPSIHFCRRRHELTECSSSSFDEDVLTQIKMVCTQKIFLNRFSED